MFNFHPIHVFLNTEKMNPGMSPQDPIIKIPKDLFRRGLMVLEQDPPY